MRSIVLFQPSCFNPMVNNTPIDLLVVSTINPCYWVILFYQKYCSISTILL